VPVRTTSRTATFEGPVDVEDAGPFTEWLRRTSHPAVRIEHCTYLHASVLQALLAFRPTITGRPADPFLARWLDDLLASPPA